MFLSAKFDLRRFQGVLKSASLLFHFTLFNGQPYIVFKIEFREIDE